MTAWCSIRNKKTEDALSTYNTSSLAQVIEKRDLKFQTAVIKFLDECSEKVFKSHSRLYGLIGEKSLYSFTFTLENRSCGAYYRPVASIYTNEFWREKFSFVHRTKYSWQAAADINWRSDSRIEKATILPQPDRSRWLSNPWWKTCWIWFDIAILVDQLDFFVLSTDTLPTLGELTVPLSQEMRAALLQVKGISKFYVHQAQAINALNEGYNVIVSTSTSR